MTLKLTILGCGSSGGVPRIGNHWGECDPSNPKNHRRRCSLLVQRFEGEGVTSVLVDTSPDMRAQLLDTGVDWLDGVLFTHEHADHTHGIDDLRMVAINGRRRIDVYMSRNTAEVIMPRFSYCFASPEDSPYPPILHQHTIYPGQPVSIEGNGGEIKGLPIDLEHGHIRALGFRFGDVAYTPDLSAIPESALPMLAGLDVWIIDALRRTYHPSHFTLEQALAAIAELKPKRAILTNMHVEMDYETLRRELPENVEPAYDLMTLEAGTELGVPGAGAASGQ